MELRRLEDNFASEAESSITSKIQSILESMQQTHKENIIKLDKAIDNHLQSKILGPLESFIQSTSDPFNLLNKYLIEVSELYTQLS